MGLFITLGTSTLSVLDKGNETSIPYHDLRATFKPITYDHFDINSNAPSLNILVQRDTLHISLPNDTTAISIANNDHARDALYNLSNVLKTAKQFNTVSDIYSTSSGSYNHNYSIGDSVSIYYYPDEISKAQYYNFATFWLPLRHFLLLLIPCFIWTFIYKLATKEY